ncbi:hypothetical protein BJY04DRAFT_217291 [Aspergillus karnatakaensis]|uniref:putative extracellular cysteine-rich protein n=1 Tax=Aspergillus karnatakaensis TaxID=1810916 RepID=UPI003CCDA471
MVKLSLILSLLAVATPILAAKAHVEGNSKPKLRIGAEDERHSYSSGNASLHVARDLDLTGLGLLARQTTCSPGRYACADGDGCCRDNQNCTPGGCCDKPNVECGSNHCYDPATEVCCRARGTSCEIGYECMISDGCCRIGRRECGDNHCYDPEEKVCCPEDGTTCDVGYTCQPTICCRNGLIECNGECYDPDSEECCGRGSGAEVCDSGETCGGNGVCSAVATLTASPTTRNSTIGAEETSTVTENDAMSGPTGVSADENDFEDEDDEDDGRETVTQTIFSGDASETGPGDNTPTDAAARDMLNAWQYGVPVVALLWRLM